MSEEEISRTPPNLKAVAEGAVEKLLPSKSRTKYDKEYQKFQNWCSANKVTRLSENVVLAYFEKLSADGYKPSSLWTVS